MIKTLAGSLRQHKKGSIITVCLSILEAAFEIIIPLCMSNLIDYAVPMFLLLTDWMLFLRLSIWGVFLYFSGTAYLKVLLLRKVMQQYLPEEAT